MLFRGGGGGPAAGAGSMLVRYFSKKRSEDVRRINPKVPREEAKAISKNLYDVIKQHGPISVSNTWNLVKGCDGSVLLDSTPNNVAEKDAPPNNPSLRGFEVIDKAKARLEHICRGIVSCADIVAFAARDSVQLTGGLPYKVPSGRMDGIISRASETRSLPPPTADLNQLTQMFANMGLSQEEMITLSGSHSIGRSHCLSFSRRLYNFNSSVSQDPSLDPSYADKLKQQCPQSNTNPSQTVPIDPPTPNIMDTSYYSGILANRGLFTSDQTLLSTPSAASQVQQNVRNWLLFQTKFVAAMIKMGQIGVLTDGEIRANCHRIN